MCELSSKKVKLFHHFAQLKEFIGENVWIVKEKQIHEAVIRGVVFKSINCEYSHAMVKNSPQNIFLDCTVSPLLEEILFTNGMRRKSSYHFLLEDLFFNREEADRKLIELKKKDIKDRIELLQNELNKLEQECTN